MTKISIYSQKCKQRGCTEERGLEAYLSQISAAADCAKTHKSDLLILPGHSLGNVGVEGGTSREDREHYIDTGIKHFQKIADTYNLTILGEIGDTYWLRPKNKLSEPMKQTLYEGEHREKEPELVAEFQNALNSGNRSLKFKSLNIRVVLCGEQNILQVPNDFIPKFPTTFDWTWNYDLLLNPTHDSMGQWNRINPRLEMLSKDKRVVIHTANNLHQSWGTALRVYHDGSMILDGNFDNDDDLEKHIEDNWRLVTIQI